MNRILEFSPSPEEAVVSRILVLVHQAVDESFPAVAQANRQFTKTLFSDGERTAIGPIPDLPAGVFVGEEDTASDNKPGQAAAATAAEAAEPLLPPPPSRPGPIMPPPPPRPAAVPMREPNAAHPNPNPPTHSAPEHASHAPTSRARGGDSKHTTALDDSMAGLEGEGADWTTRITIGLLIAGLVLLAYALFF